MSFRLTRTPKFERQVQRFARAYPDAARRLPSVFADLEEDPHKPRLRLHPLRGELHGFHAVWITFDQRLVLELHESENEIVLVNIGSHDEVYR